MEAIITFIILLLVSYFVVMDAKSRGMNASFWGAFVLLFLIIGLPAYFISRKPKLSTKTITKNSNSEAEILLDLKEKKILSEEEYQQKLKLLSDIVSQQN